MIWPMSPNHAAVWAIVLPHYYRLTANTFVSTTDWLDQLDHKERDQAHA